MKTIILLIVLVLAAIFIFKLAAKIIKFVFSLILIGGIAVGYLYVEHPDRLPVNLENTITNVFVEKVKHGQEIIDKCTEDLENVTGYLPE